jgi:hypothetical protein
VLSSETARILDCATTAIEGAYRLPPALFAVRLNLRKATDGIAVAQAYGTLDAAEAEVRAVLDAAAVQGERWLETNDSQGSFLSPALAFEAGLSAEEVAATGIQTPLFAGDVAAREYRAIKIVRLAMERGAVPAGAICSLRAEHVGWAAAAMADVRFYAVETLANIPGASALAEILAVSEEWIAVAYAEVSARLDTTRGRQMSRLDLLAAECLTGTLN